MPLRLLMVAPLLLLCAVPGRAVPPEQARDIQTVARQGRGSPEGRAAWERLSAAGPEVLLPLLHALDTPDVVAANWLRTAFDRVLDRAIEQKGRPVDVD